MPAFGAIAPDGVAITGLRRGGGEPVLVLHGFTGSARSMEPLTGELARSWTVIAPDLRGHGGSGAPDGPAAYHVERLIGDLDAVLDVNGAGNAAIVGYSLGARLALCYAIARPDRVRCVVAISAGLGYADPEAARERRNRDEELAEGIEGNGVEWFVERWSRHPAVAGQRRAGEDAWAAATAARLANRPAGLAGMLRGFGQASMPVLDDGLTRCRMPVLAIAGSLDPAYVAQAERLMRARSLYRLTFAHVRGQIASKRRRCRQYLAP